MPMARNLTAGERRLANKWGDIDYSGTYTRGGEVKSRPSVYTEVQPGVGLGFSPQTLQTIAGAGRDAWAGEFAGAQQRLADTFRTPGTTGLGSGEYLYNKSALENARVAANSAQLAEAIKEDEMLRRSDWMARNQALSGYLGTLMQGRQAYAAGRTRTMGTSRGLSGTVSYGAA